MRFGFYLNPIVRLRDPDTVGEPEPAVVVGLAAAAGAQVVLAGWTPSSGELTERDVRLIRDVVWIDLLLVVPQDRDLVEPVVKLQPQGVVLVSSGWDGRRDFRPVQLEVDAEEIGSVTSAYNSAGLKVSLLIEPNSSALKVAARRSLSAVVLDASAYAGAHTDEEAQIELDKLADSAMVAQKFGLHTAVGHGLTYHTLGPVAALKYVDEIYAGRAVSARAVVNGIDRAIRDYIAEIDRNRTF